MAWTPTSAKTWEWLKVAWFQSASVALWQVSQVVAKPAVECFGFVVASYWGLWQPTQSRGVPVKTLFLWQAAQGCVLWTPTSGKTGAWLNVAWFQSASVALWQVSQAVPNPAAECFGLVVASYRGLWQPKQSRGVPA